MTATVVVPGAARARRWLLVPTVLVSLSSAHGCGSVPEDPCVEFVNPQLQSTTPSVVRVAFQLASCGGRDPLPNKTLEDFRLLEDRRAVSEYESGAAIVRDDRSFRQSVVILLDVSGSMLENLPALKTAARSMVQGLSRSPEVALYTFDGRAEPTERAAFTTDLSAITRAIEALSEERVDTSTNLNGAVVASLRLLDAREQQVQAVGSLYAGALALFTDGTDRAARVTRQEAIEAAERSRAAVFAIGLGQEIEPGYLRAVAHRGKVALASEVDNLTDAFSTIGESISALANSYYVLAYCSPSRAGTHEFALELPGHRGTYGGSFDASGFTGGCTAADFVFDLNPAP